jgi:D-alanyl-lipoteichoic acid acyltransferase DltB (MBOAT superfamily)
VIDAVSFLVIILLTIGLSHVVLPHDSRSRLFWAVMPGLLLLFIVHPLALVFAMSCCAASVAVFLLGCRVADTRVKARIPYSLLLLLFIPDIVGLASDAPILWLGSAFFIVRQMMTVAQGIKHDIELGKFVPALLMATFFFAALPSGPVFNGLRTWDRLGKQEDRAYVDGCYRLFEGFVYLFAIAGLTGAVGAAMGRVGSASADLPAASLAVIDLVFEPLTAFAFLFATFYGYSRMAEGSALLLGFEVPQNFNKPHLARDLGDFWKRWHRSMAEFVMQYIYLPLLVTTSHAKLALIAAFVFMGLWHNFSAAFMIWGVGHGIGLAFILPWAQRLGARPAALRAGSLVYVIALSSVAHGVWMQ